jgi:hypothetical protein
LPGLLLDLAGCQNLFAFVRLPSWQGQGSEVE